MSAKKSDFTVHDCLAGAFQALLRGDTHQRDVLCAMAEKAMNGDICPADTPVQTQPIPLKSIKIQ